MRMDKLAGSGNDEFYTPVYAVLPILGYIPVDATVWCPFDTEESVFVKILKARGNKVIYSHISRGQNFFEYEPQEHYDLIVSNPPYSLKNEVFDRLYHLGKPFAMLVGVVGIFESQFRFNMFKNNPVEVMYLNKRVSYFKSYADDKPAMNPPFSSIYLCSNMLGKQIVFKEIDKKLLDIGEVNGLL